MRENFVSYDTKFSSRNPAKLQRFSEFGPSWTSGSDPTSDETREPNFVSYDTFHRYLRSAFSNCIIVPAKEEGWGEGKQHVRSRCARDVQSGFNLRYPENPMATRAGASEVSRERDKPRS